MSGIGVVSTPTRSPMMSRPPACPATPPVRITIHLPSCDPTASRIGDFGNSRISSGEPEPSARLLYNPYVWLLRSDMYITYRPSGDHVGRKLRRPSTVMRVSV